MKYIFVAYIIWNLITFTMMGVDKYKSKHKKWRISEAALLTSAFIMGGVGAIIGSHAFKHKTQKIKFKVLLPVAVVINAMAMYLINMKLMELDLFN